MSQPKYYFWERKLEQHYLLSQYDKMHTVCPEIFMVRNFHGWQALIYEHPTIFLLIFSVGYTYQFAYKQYHT